MAASHNPVQECQLLIIVLDHVCLLFQTAGGSGADMAALLLKWVVQERGEWERGGGGREGGKEERNGKERGRERGGGEEAFSIKCGGFAYRIQLFFFS